MNKKNFSPYIRVAMHSVLSAPFHINDRVIFDYEIILVTDGLCNITIGNTTYLCKKNDVVFIRPGVLHKFECVNGTDFSQPHIHFDVTYSQKSEKRYICYQPKNLLTEKESSLISEDVFSDIGIPDVFCPTDPVAFQKTFFEIIDLFQKKPYNYELLYKIKMLELIDSILKQFDHNRTVDESYHPTVLVKHYLDHNYLSVITLDALSKQFYCNKYTLMRKFRAMYHQTIISYYHSKRIEYMKNVLKTTNLPIHILAEQMNFSDMYSFSRFFKMYVGCSPTAYRKQIHQS